LACSAQCVQWCSVHTAIKLDLIKSIANWHALITCTHSATFKNTKNKCSVLSIYAALEFRAAGCKDNFTKPISLQLLKLSPQPRGWRGSQSISPTRGCRMRLRTSSSQLHNAPWQKTSCARLATARPHEQNQRQEARETLQHILEAILLYGVTAGSLIPTMLDSP